MARLRVGFGVIFELTIGVIFLILLIIITTKSFLYLSCKTSESQKTFVTSITPNNKQKLTRRKINISYKPFIRYGTLASLTLYLTSNICSLCHMFILLSTSDITAFSGPLLFDIAVFGWTLARICMRFVFVARLKYSFECTQWEYSRCVFIALYCLLSMFPIIMCYFLFEKIEGKGDIWKDELQTKINTIVFGLMMALDVLFPLLLIFLFQRKLFQLIKSYLASIEKFQNRQNDHDLNIDIGGSLKHMETETHSVVSLPSLQTDSKHTNSGLMEVPTKSSAVGPNDPDHDDIPFRIQKKDVRSSKYGKVYISTKCMFINTITQYTLLICVAMIMSLSHMIYPLTKRNATQPMNQTELLYYQFHYEFSSLFMSFINPLCLFLQFPFGLKLYKLLCSNRLCLHRLCVSCYTTYTH